MRRLFGVSLTAVAVSVFCACTPYYQGAAQREYAMGQLDAAASDVQSALYHDPDNLQLKHLAAEIFTQRGLKYYQSQEMLAASEDFRRAVDYDTFYAPAWDYLGLIAFSQHNWQDAVNFGSKAAQLSGKPNPAYVQQAETELREVRAGGPKSYREMRTFRGESKKK
jgi:tetratricopeptide (TPR) repeat protein